MNKLVKKKCILHCLILYPLVLVHFGGKPRPFGKTLTGVLLTFKMPGGGICSP
uniref:Uncharacterized protein n=1 Tax=Romanomermis culicivorax TaxID=13658 RepID=A0A915HU28_ROMCU